MDHPPDDRRVSGGAVVAAWAIVAGLVAVALIASVLATPAPMTTPVTEQAALHGERGFGEAGSYGSRPEARP